MRRPDLMVREHFLAEDLVFAQKQGFGPGSRISYVHQFQQRRDVRLVRAVMIERLRKVEHHVRRVGLQFVHNRGDVIENCQRVHIVAQAFEAAENVGLGRLILVLERAHGKDFIGFCRPRDIEQDKNFHVLDRPLEPACIQVVRN